MSGWPYGRSTLRILKSAKDIVFFAQRASSFKMIEEGSLRYAAIVNRLLDFNDISHLHCTKFHVNKFL